VDDEAHSSYAQNIVREILKEVLPYMNIYPDEELTGMNADLTISGSDGLVAPSTTTATTTTTTTEEEQESGDVFEEEGDPQEEEAGDNPDDESGDEPDDNQEAEPQEEEQQ
jgi:stage V sporulation protein D (sporulation-specific penicillin-binding protein)